MFQLDKKHQKYEKYNPTNIDWIGDIPDGWEVRRIKTFSQVRRGASPRPIDDPIYFDDNGEYAWVRIADVSASDRYLIEASQRLSALGQSLSVEIEPGELFVSIAGTVGKPIISGIKCCIHDGFVYFKNLKYNKELLYWVFTGGEAYKGLGKLGTQLNLNTESIGNIALPFPSKEVQGKMTNYLDEKTALLDEAIEKKNKQIELLVEHRTALINDAITKGLDKNVEMKDSGIEWIGEIPKGWEVKKMKYLASVCNGSDYKEIEVQDGKYSVFGSGGEFARTNTYVFNKPSVLLGRKGTIDKPLFVIEPFWTVDTMFYTKIFNNTYPKFFYYQCLNINFKEHQSGSALPSMTQGILLNIHFPTPKLQEQKEIADYLDKETKYIDDMIAKIEKSIELLEEYKTSLISHVVSGKIKVG